MTLVSPSLTRLALVIAIGAPAMAVAQGAAPHIAIGDSLHAAMKPAEALVHYEAALAAEPGNYVALTRAARNAVDVGENTKAKEERSALYRKGELYARRAVEANPQHADGHFYLARALGRAALALGPRDRIKYANDVRGHALEALKFDPGHPGALHVMGMWNAEVMRLSGPTRWIARNVLGGQVFGSASWDSAVRYMEQSVAAEPDRIAHHIDLAKIYLDVKDKARARAEFETVLRLPATDYNDRFYKADADAHLKKLR